MLIVIVIIGILAAALIPRLQSIQWRARDAERKADMVQINNGLAIYNNDYGYIPHTIKYSGQIIEFTPWWNRDYSSSWAFLPFLVSWGIMTSVPLDPINNVTANPPTTGMYAYRYYCYEPAINSTPTTGFGAHLWYYRESPVARTYIWYNGWNEQINPAGYAANWYDVSYKCR